MSAPTPVTGTVTISGNVSAETAAGESVTLTITKPDGTTTTVSAVTTADTTNATQGDFSATYTDNAAASGYSVVASVAQVGVYKAAASASVAFGILAARTVTVSVA